MEIEINDIIKNENSYTYRYGEVVKIEGDKIWCWWAEELGDLSTKNYTNRGFLMYSTSNGLIIIKKKNSTSKNKYEFLFKDA